MRYPYLLRSLLEELVSGIEYKILRGKLSRREVMLILCQTCWCCFSNYDQQKAVG